MRLSLLLWVIDQSSTSARMLLKYKLRKRLLMFNYDSEYVANNAGHAMEFFYRFLWRSMVAVPAINIVLVLPVMAITDAPLAWYLVLQVGCLLGLAVALRWVAARAPERLNKKNGISTRIQFHREQATEQFFSLYFLRLGFAIYWRALIMAIVLYWPCHWVMVALFDFSSTILEGPVFGVIVLWVAWLWWTLFSSPESRQILFVTEPMGGP